YSFAGGGDFHPATSPQGRPGGGGGPRRAGARGRRDRQCTSTSGRPTKTHSPAVRLTRPTAWRARGNTPGALWASSDRPHMSRVLRTPMPRRTAFLPLTSPPAASIPTAPTCATGPSAAPLLL